MYKYVQTTSKLISLSNCLTSYIYIYSRSNLEFSLIIINRIISKLARLEINKISNSVTRLTLNNQKVTEV